MTRIGILVVQTAFLIGLLILDALLILLALCWLATHWIIPIAIILLYAYLVRYPHREIFSDWGESVRDLVRK